MYLMYVDIDFSNIYVLYVELIFICSKVLFIIFLFCFLIKKVNNNKS